MRYDASECVVAFEQVLANREGDFVKNEALRVDYLQYFQHVDVVVENVLGDHSWNK